MNIKHYLSAAAAITLFAACSDYDPGESGNVVDLTDAEIETIEEYTANFINRYGEPAEGHTWGFGAKGSEDEMGTRLVNVNRNEWAKPVRDEDNNIIGWTTANFGSDPDKKMVVPGFPSKVVGDGLYYIEESVLVGDNQYQNQINGYTEQQLIEKGRDSYNPVGDVTDEEIQYVSEWFRSNQYPDSETPPFTEFFIQDISQDYDRQSYPNGEAINRNLTVYVGGTLDEKGWFVGGTPDNGTDPIKFGMDYFAVKTSEAPWEHENNFNAQKANKLEGSNPNNETLFPNRTLKYWTTNGGYTTSFKYNNSDNSTYYENYVLVHLSFDGPRTGRHYDGYYLAFDYQYQKMHATSTDENGNTTYKYSQVKPDGYHSNWIVKLAPADPEWKKEEHSWHRVMCEDLGATDDYDFNDLVYDVYFTGTSETGYTAHIKVQASGGTLPIYVGTYTETNERECHQILQNGNAKMSGELYVPVNVAAGVTADPVEFEFEMKDASDNWLTGDAGTDPDNIPILVTSQDKSRQEAAHKNTFELLHSTESVVPQKICIDGNLTDATKVRWMKERKQIETSYTLFDSWVTGGSNSDYHFGKSQDWTNHGLSNTGNLY